MTIICYAYIFNYLKAEDKIELTEIYQEAGMVSFALFMVFD